MSESLKEKFNKIKAVFENTIPAPAPTPTPQEKQFSQYTLMDGTEVEVDKLEAGGVLSMKSQPAPAGDYELSDGTKLKVGEGGVIEAVEAAPAADPAQEMSSKFSALEADYNSHKQAFAQYQQSAEQRFQGYEKSIQDFSTALNQSNENVKQLMGIVEQLLKEETANPAETKTNFSKVEDKRKGLEKYIKTLHSNN